MSDHPTMTLTVEGMHCGSCVARVEKAALSVPGVMSATANLATHHISVAGGTITAVTDALDRAGYPSKIIADLASEDHHIPEDPNLKRDLFLSAVFTLPLFIIAMGGHLIPPFGMWLNAQVGQSTLWVLQFILATIVLFGPGMRFMRSGVPALFRGAPDMNSLVTLGVGAAWAFSTLVVFAPNLIPSASQDVYFEAAAVIVTLILLGRFLEARAKGQTGAAIEKLVRLQPKTATLLTGDQSKTVAIATIVPGDILQLKPGERVAVDGEVVAGASHLDESMMTGEAVPVDKSEGALLYAGTVNGRGVLSYRATKVGGETVLSQIIEMVSRAQGARLPVQNVVNQITLWFVPAILVIAALTFGAWMIWGPSLGFALVACVSVLIIACPCAMGLAVPTSIMVGMGRAAEMGVFFRKGAALQTLHQATAVAFDKTGTLTIGSPIVTSIQTFGSAQSSDVLAIAAALESQSEHALADAVLTKAATDNIPVPTANNVAAVAGRGITGQINGATALAGSRALMGENGIATDTISVEGTAIYVALDGVFLGVLTIEDALRPEAQHVTQYLHDADVGVAMITGDNASAAARIAGQLTGIDTVSDVLPDGKVAALNGLGPKTVFVGDGINDAPALAASYVGIAVGSGTDVAIESADVVLISGDLRGVVNAFDVSHATMRNIRQNLTWAFGYNVLLIPVAAGVFYPMTGLLLSPMLAAGAMALSSVFVVTNALRLRRIKAHQSATPAVSG